MRIERCRGCNAEIVWLRTIAGKVMPVDASTVTSEATIYDAKAGHVSHFATCSQAEKFRKPKEKK